MASAGEVTLYVNVVTMDQGEIAAVECDRCAALVPRNRKAKHDRVCVAVRVDDMAAAINALQKKTQHRKRTH